MENGLKTLRKAKRRQSGSNTEIRCMLYKPAELKAVENCLKALNFITERLNIKVLEDTGLDGGIEYRLKYDCYSVAIPKETFDLLKKVLDVEHRQEVELK